MKKRNMKGKDFPERVNMGCPTCDHYQASYWVIIPCIKCSRNKFYPSLPKSDLHTGGIHSNEY